MDAVPKGKRLNSTSVSVEGEFRLNYKGCIYSYRCENMRDRCREERPELREVEDGHWVACHFPIEIDSGAESGVARSRPA